MSVISYKLIFYQYISYLVIVLIDVAMLSVSVP